MPALSWAPPVFAFNSRTLSVATRRRRRHTKVWVPRLQRILVLAQGRVIGRQRHRKARRQIAFQQAGALQFVETGQVADLLQPERAEALIGGAIGDRPAWRLAAAARTDPPRAQQHI